MLHSKQKALERFRSYVSSYDPANPRIALKIAHTLRVADLCERIAPCEKDIAWLCGLLHDIGRFEQVRRYDTFNDAASVNHATLGVQVLFDEGEAPLIRSFIPSEAHDELIRTAIATHSDFRLPKELDRRTKMHCTTLRDADKIDIIKVNCICPIDDIYGVTENDMAASLLSPEVVECFYDHSTVPRGIRRYPADILVGHICFAWELEHHASLQILCEQGHIFDMLSRTFTNPQTQETFTAMAVHMKEWLR